MSEGEGISLVSTNYTVGDEAERADIAGSSSENFLHLTLKIKI